MAVLEARGLTKDYPRVRALDALTLEVPEGALGLLGQNGAGKSTLLKICLGFQEPTAGEVRVLGLDPRTSAIEIRQRIGFMPEMESFIPGASAVDFVHLAARLTGLPPGDAMQRTHMALNYVGVHEERYRGVETYSTGMKQKVKLAQAIVHHPKLLLLDEPTAGLDPRARDEMLALIRDIVRRGISVILSTHLLHDVETVCDRAAILHLGKLVEQDEIAALTTAAEDAWEVRLKGDPAGFLEALRAEGLAPESAEDGRIRVAHAGSTDPLLRAAVRSGAQIRALSRTRTLLEDRFARLVGEA